MRLIPGLTAAQNIFLTREPLRFGLGLINYKEMNADAQTRIDRYGFPLKATSPIESLSIARRQLAEILNARSGDARHLNLGEPTSTLTSTETVQIFDIVRQLKASGVSMVYISRHTDHPWFSAIARWDVQISPFQP